MDTKEWKRKLSLFIFNYSFALTVRESAEDLQQKLALIIKEGYEHDDSTIQRFRGKVIGKEFSAELITPDVRGVSFAVYGTIASEGKHSVVSFRMRVQDNFGLKMLMGFLALAFGMFIFNKISRASAIKLEQFNGFFIFAMFGLSVMYLFTLGTYWWKCRLTEKIFREAFLEGLRKEKKQRWVPPQNEESNKEGTIVFKVSAAILAILSVCLMIFHTRPESLCAGIFAMVIFSLFGGGLCSMLWGSIRDLKTFRLHLKQDFQWVFFPLSMLNLSAAITLALGFAFFINGGLATLGFTPWISAKTEMPIMSGTEVVRNSKEELYCYLEFICRIQKYDKDGTFLVGWRINSSGKHISFRLNKEDNLEVVRGGNSFCVYSPEGDLMKKETINNEKKLEFEKKCKDTVSARDTILMERIRNQPFYFWFFAGPQCLIFFITGMLFTFLSSPDFLGKWLFKSEDR